MNHPSGPVELSVRNVRKSFGRLVALDDVSLEIRSGEVHALVGENGAGKTTFASVVSGLYKPDAGTLEVQGRPVEIRSPSDAIGAGIGMVHQHFELVGAFTGLENIVLTPRSGTHEEDAPTEIARLGERYGLLVPFRTFARDLDMGDRQKLEILRLLYSGAKLLILDEPTTHLTPDEVDNLLDGIRKLAASGYTIVLIAHKLHEVLSVADRVTVMRRGRLVGTLEGEEKSRARIIEMMIGTAQKGEQAPLRDDRQMQGGEVLLSLSNVSADRKQSSVPLDGISFDVAAGEVVGVAGVAGNGQRTLFECLVGTTKIDRGEVRLTGRDISRWSVRNRIRGGLASLPGDRLREGVLPSAPLFESYVLGMHVLPIPTRWNRETLRKQAAEMIPRFDVRTSDENVPTAALSGGNIQKVLVARALQIAMHRDTGVLLAMNPTNGLDVAATRFVHEQMLEMCRKDRAVLLISEDLDELTMLCDRIVVMAGGRLTGMFNRDEFDRYQIGERMVG